MRLYLRTECFCTSWKRTLSMWWCITGWRTHTQNCPIQVSCQHVWAELSQSSGRSCTERLWIHLSLAGMTSSAGTVSGLGFDPSRDRWGTPEKDQKQDVEATQKPGSQGLGRLCWREDRRQHRMVLRQRRVELHRSLKRQNLRSQEQWTQGPRPARRSRWNPAAHVLCAQEAMFDRMLLQLMRPKGDLLPTPDRRPDLLMTVTRLSSQVA